jgi:predicted alpha/beta hydrolase family esterase
MSSSKRQVIVIHGGNEFASDAEFWKWFWSPETLAGFFSGPFRGFFGKKRWKKNLPADLGAEYEVFLPRFPHPHNAKYAEWKKEFEKLFPMLRDGVILVGHSLGGIFLAKYLSEETFPRKIRAVFLVAAVYDSDGEGTQERKIVQFALPPSLELLEKQAPEIFLYHSTDDPVVSFNELAKFQEKLPHAKTTVFSDRGHFDQIHFPEITEEIAHLREQLT